MALNDPGSASDMAGEATHDPSGHHGFNWNSLPEVVHRTDNHLVQSAKVELVLRDHERVLCGHIDSLKRGDYIFIACAWLTETPMLERLIAAVQERQVFCQIVVQKERWLRTKESLLAKYAQLGENMYDADMIPFTEDNSVGVGGKTKRSGRMISVGAVRVFGEGQDTEARPLMHHKMAIMGRFVRNEHGNMTCFSNRLVLGSFNWTRRSTRSLESVIIAHNSALAAIAQQHYSAILRESEPLAFRTLCKSPAGSFAPALIARRRRTGGGPRC